MLTLGIFLTPFHLRQYNNLNINRNNEILFVSNQISFDFVKCFFDLKKVIVFEEINFRKKDLLKYPFKKIIEYRNAIKKYKQFVNKCISLLLTNKYLDEPVNVYIFSEKHIFVQILISNLKKVTKCKVIEIDEGIGFYLKNDFLDYILKILYPIVNYLLLGFPYRYYKVLGTSTFIDELYVRFPEFICGKRKCQVYKLDCKKVQNQHFISSDNKLLLLTSPLSEDRILSEKKEIKLIEKVVFAAVKAGYNVFIKPHPRENIDKYRFLKENYKQHISLLTEILSEEINYFEYKYIINFGSSSVLDIFSSNFPLKNIITIDIFKISKKIPLYNFTKVINYKEVKKIDDIIKCLLY
jgi:hypothetical protein